MANYIPGGQKRDKIVAKRERTLIGAIKRGEPGDRLCVLAEKLREAKISACGENSDRARSRLKWEAYTPEEIVKRYRDKSEQGAS